MSGPTVIRGWFWLIVAYDSSTIRSPENRSRWRRPVTSRLRYRIRLDSIIFPSAWWPSLPGTHDKENADPESDFFHCPYPLYSDTVGAPTVHYHVIEFISGYSNNNVSHPIFCELCERPTQS